ncbi:hypothetical protein Tco_1394082 [Tanacetum coccineum]
MIHTQCNAQYEKLEKETQIKISNLEECVRIKDRQHIIRANDDFIIFENLRGQVKELQSENEHLKSKVVDCTMCQNLQVQVEELKSVNESLNLSIEELSKARALVEETLIERDKMISAQCKKIRLLEEQYNSLEKMVETIEKEYESNVSNIFITSSTFETEHLELVKEMGDKVKCFDDEKKLSTRTDKFETYFANLEKQNALLKSQLASQNYTSLQKENNDLRTSYNVLKEKYEISCEKLEQEIDDLKMHYKRLFDTAYSLQKDRKYLNKQHSSETFASQNHVKNESSKQVWKRKENISKWIKYSRNEMFSMRKRGDSVLKKVKDVRFPFISKRIFQNETPSFNNKWKSSSSSRVKTSNETPGFRTVFTPLRSFKIHNVHKVL